ncbi:MAG: hypothetical protein AB7E42_09445 [Anaerotignaceae bacterium]
MKKKSTEIRMKECFKNSDYMERNINVVRIVAKLIEKGENLEK